MTNRNMLGAHAIVVGAGIGGLAAAAALAPYFDKVTLIERDALPTAPEARPGVGQASHSHLLLKAGEGFAEDLLPGIRNEFLAAGAVELNVNKQWHFFDSGSWLPSLDCGFSVLSMSRPAYEHVLRERVRRIANVTFLEETSVQRFDFENGRATGLTLADPSASEIAPADLIVDASGAGGPIVEQLRADGLGDVPTDYLGVKITYTTGVFERPEAFAGTDEIFYCSPTPPDVHWGMLLPIEGGRWSVSLNGRGDVYPPRELEGFLAYAKDLAAPHIHDRIKEARLQGSLRSFRKLRSHWRHFEDFGNLPDRFIPLGDTITSFNPTFGQGMTVAIGHARLLADVLGARAQNGSGLDGLAQDYLPNAAKLSGLAWRQAAFTDLAFAQTEGERPDDYEMTAMGVRLVRKLIETDNEMLALRLKVANMLESPQVFREGPMLERIMLAMQQDAAS